jgi:Mg-chelatase subunit ChlI
MLTGNMKYIIAIVLMSVLSGAALGDSARLVDQGNKLYSQGSFNEAIAKYDEVLVENPAVLEPKFNKAASYYRLDDLANARDLYKDVAVQSKDMKLVTKAKYNLGNCSFQQGIKQKDSDLQKAVDEMKTAIGHWRSVLDIDSENEKAAKNIEVARLTIKDLLDQLKNQQQQDPNQPNQQQQQQQQQDQQQQDQQQLQDPNQPQPQGQDPNEQQGQEKQEPKEEEQQQQQQEEQKEQQAPDTTAQQILDKEQEQQKNRQMMQRGRWQKVDKDW